METYWDLKETWEDADFFGDLDFEDLTEDEIEDLANRFRGDYEEKVLRNLEEIVKKEKNMDVFWEYESAQDNKFGYYNISCSLCDENTEGEMFEDEFEMKKYIDDSLIKATEIVNSTPYIDWDKWFEEIKSERD